MLLQPGVENQTEVPSGLCQEGAMAKLARGVLGFEGARASIGHGHLLRGASIGARANGLGLKNPEFARTVPRWV